MAKPQERDQTIFDYYPEVAGAYENAHDLLDQGRWTGEIALRGHRGQRVRRRLWVELAGYPAGWGLWGLGERFLAAERMPPGLLRCALFYPHHWLEQVSVARFFTHYDPRTSKVVLTALAGFYSESRRCGIEPGEKEIVEFCYERLPAGSTSVLEEKSLEIFAKLLPARDSGAPRGGPPGSGLAFVRELHRRLRRSGVPSESIPFQIRSLIFGLSLPDDDPRGAAAAFFIEALKFLHFATSGRLAGLREEGFRRTVVEFGEAVRRSATGVASAERTVREVGDLVLRVVYGGEKPSLGNSPDYLKYLKAASLADDHGYDDDRIASIIGISDIGNASGKPAPQGGARLEHYKRSGRTIRAAIPQDLAGDP